MDFKKKCGTCANQGTFQDGSPGCAKFKIKVDLNKDFCSWHADKDIPHCKFCNETQNLILAYFGNNFIPVCEIHEQLFHTCQTCEKSKQCGFREDTSEPQFVMRQVRQGNMVMQTQVKNPNLVEKHCRRCSCYFPDSGDGRCLQEGQTENCPLWSLQKELLQ